MPQTTSQNTCKPYFDYDELDHFFLNIDDTTLWNTEKKDSKTLKEKKQLDLLLQWTPEKISDSIVVKNLEGLDFVKTDISPDMFGEINKIFCERKHKEVFMNSCIAEYRDILIFKKTNKIIGIAKLCFSCEQSVIIRTTFNTSEFGQSGDYKKLYDLLHPDI